MAKDFFVWSNHTTYTLYFHYHNLQTNIYAFFYLAFVDFFLAHAEIKDFQILEDG